VTLKFTEVISPRRHESHSKEHSFDSSLLTGIVECQWKHLICNKESISESLHSRNIQKSGNKLENEMINEDVAHRIKIGYQNVSSIEQLLDQQMLCVTECWTTKMCGHTTLGRTKTDHIRKKVQVAHIEDTMKECRLI
ncbi:hypothetical protein H5410_057574, partial [Solanum commersonii]